MNFLSYTHLSRKSYHNMIYSGFILHDVNCSQEIKITALIFRYLKAQIWYLPTLFVWREQQVQNCKIGDITLFGKFCIMIGCKGNNYCYNLFSLKTSSNTSYSDLFRQQCVSICMYLVLFNIFIYTYKNHLHTSILSGVYFKVIF